MARKNKIDPKYRNAYDHLTLAELCEARSKVRRDIDQENAAAQGDGLRGEIARANRRELWKQEAAIEARVAAVIAKQEGKPLIEIL